MKGLRVIDFTIALAGSFGTFLMRERGAEVIHIGRVMRRSKPTLAEQLYLKQINFNKICIELDLKSPEGKGLALRLASLADVVVDNFRPGTMARLGLGPEALRRERPDLVVVSASAAGSKSNDIKVGYAQTFAALAGLSALTGYPGGPPVEMRHPADSTVGMVTGISALAALLRRRRYGGGAIVDVSARDAVLWSIGHEVVAAQCPNYVMRQSAERDPRRAPNNAFCAADGEWIAIAVNTDAEWRSLCGVIGANAALASLGSTLSGRVAHRDAIEARLTDWVRGITSRSAVGTLQDAGVPAFLVLTTDLAYNDEHLAARGSWHAVPEMNVRVLSMPWRPPGATGAAPHPGMDGEVAREYVFTKLLGLPGSELAALVARDIVG